MPRRLKEMTFIVSHKCTNDPAGDVLREATITVSAAYGVKANECSHCGWELGPEDELEEAVVALFEKARDDVFGLDAVPALPSFICSPDNLPDDNLPDDTAQGQ